MRIKLDSEHVDQLRAGVVPTALINRIDSWLLAHEIFDDFVTAAREMYEDEGRIEIDSDASASVADEGCYVEAWVWVSNERVGRGDPIDDGEPA